MTKNATIENFMDLEFLEKLLAIRASNKATEFNKLLSESSASKKEQENEIFALDYNRLSRLHIIYVCLKMAREQMAKHTFPDANVVKFLEIALKVFALKQLVLDN